MGTLHAFLHPETPEQQEIVISTRFKDEKGNPVPFIIRAISQEENEGLRKKATRTYKDKRTGESVREFDGAKFTRLFTIAGTVRPDFQATELCEAYSVLDPELVLGKMLLAGEYSRLSEAIANLSGINEDDLGQEAKN